jgi:hypothetical protein
VSQATGGNSASNSKPARLKRARTVYRVLATHQMSDRWDYRDLLRDLHHWAEVFSDEFKLGISNIALRVDGLRVRRLGRFSPHHNGFGLEREIGIERRTLHTQEFWQLLGTLLHQLLHAWQEDYGKPAKGHYHNRQFQRKAAEFGLIVNGRGDQHYQPNSLFTEVLRAHGVVIPEFPEPPPLLMGSSKLKLWVCACEPPFRLRVARTGFQAICSHCGHEFVQLDGRQDAGVSGNW